VTHVLCSLAISTLGVAEPAGDPLSVSDPPLLRAEGVEMISESGPSIPHVALVFDAGAPDGAGASLAIRPWSWIRLNAGIVTNSVSPGLRAGATLIPFHFGISPTLTVEAGHFFDGDANRSIGFVLQDSSFYNATFTHVGYDFASGQLGIEVGPPDRWTFYLRLGLSYVHASPAFAQALEQASSKMPSALSAGQMASGQGWVVIPSLKAGLTLYLF
jgi:hypothetical protein